MAFNISGTLVDQANNRNQSPYVKVTVVTNEVGPVETSYDTEGILVYCRKTEEVWADDAEVWLSNHDQALSALDYTGRRVEISYGYVASGNESQERAPVWVMSQRFVSGEGYSYLVLSCWGIMNLLSQHSSGGDSIGAAPSWNIASFADTVEDIITSILATLSPAGFSSGIGLTVPAGLLDSQAPFTTTGVFKEYMPQVVVEWGTPASQLIRRVMDFTKVVLKTRPDGAHAVFPDPADSVDETYETSGTYTHIREELSQGLTVPNTIIYVNQVPDIDGTRQTYIATAVDATSQGRVGTLTQLFTNASGTELGTDVAVTGAQETQIRADAILATLQNESESGSVDVRPNPGSELWDKIRVIDTNSGSDITGRVGRLEFIWDARPGTTGRRRYVLNIQFGSYSDAISQAIPLIEEELSFAQRFQQLSATITRSTRTKTLNSLLHAPAGSLSGDLEGGAPRLIQGSGVLDTTFTGAIFDKDGLQLIGGDATDPFIAFWDAGKQNRLGLIYQIPGSGIAIFTAAGEDLILQAGGGTPTTVRPLNASTDLGSTGVRWDNLYLNKAIFNDASEQVTAFLGATSVNPLVASWTYAVSMSVGDLVYVSTADTVDKVDTIPAGIEEKTIGRVLDAGAGPGNILMYGPLAVVGTDGVVTAGDYVKSGTTPGRVQSSGVTRVLSFAGSIGATATAAVSVRTDAHIHPVDNHDHAFTAPASGSPTSVIVLQSHTHGMNAHTHTQADSTASGSTIGTGSDTHRHTEFDILGLTSTPSDLEAPSNSNHVHAQATTAGNSDQTLAATGATLTVVNSTHTHVGTTSPKTGLNTGASTSGTNSVAAQAHTHPVSLLTGTLDPVLGIAKTTVGGAGSQNLTIVMMR